MDVQFDGKETVQIYMVFIENSGDCLPMRWLGDLSILCLKDGSFFWVRKRGDENSSFIEKSACQSRFQVLHIMLF